MSLSQPVTVQSAAVPPEARHATAGVPLAGGAIFLVLAAIAVVIVLLWIPVMGDRITGFVSKKAAPAAPRAFLLGLGILLAGLIAGVGVLEAAGGGLMGLVVLGAILDNY